MVDTWVVVADGGHARFFSTDAEMAELTPVKELTNKHHAAHRHGGGGGHDSAHHAEETRFAAEIAHEIDVAVKANAVKDVVLVAPARFLGDLDGALPKSATGHVTGRVGKDFTKVERHELGRRVKAALVDNHDAH